MAGWSVRVYDPAGNEVRRVDDIDVTLRGSNAEDAGIDDADAALLLAAPEVCPWDCDHCRS